MTITPEQKTQKEIELMRQKGAIAVAVINNARANSGLIGLNADFEKQLIQLIKKAQATLD